MLGNKDSHIHTHTHTHRERERGGDKQAHAHARGDTSHTDTQTHRHTDTHKACSTRSISVHQYRVSGVARVWCVRRCSCSTPGIGGCRGVWNVGGRGCTWGAGGATCLATKCNVESYQDPVGTQDIAEWQAQPLQLNEYSDVVRGQYSRARTASPSSEDGRMWADLGICAVFAAVVCPPAVLRSRVGARRHVA